jgi:MoxR-like ATPase
VVGKRDLLEMMIASVLAGGHILLEDFPGLGKTLVARSFATALGLEFKRIQFTPDLLPGDITGGYIFNRTKNKFELRKGAVFANIVLADEINRASPKTQSALLAAMQEGHVTIEGETLPLPDPFLVLATQNPIEYEGTFPLPEAQLDRFLFKIIVPYPSDAEELAILTQFHHMGNTKPNDIVKPVLNAQQINDLKLQIKGILMEEKLLQFIAKLIHQTRNHKSIYLGASPRASLAVMNAAKAIAAMQGRDFTTPDDIREVVIPVLRHRIILAPDKEMEGVTEDEVIKQIIQGMDVPR